MLKQVESPSAARVAGNKVCKKYRQRLWKRECRNLKSILPTVAKKRVSDVEVIEEAVEYIEQLHRAIADRLGIMPCQQMIAALHMQHKMKMVASSNTDVTTQTNVTNPHLIHSNQQNNFAMDKLYHHKQLPISYRV